MITKKYMKKSLSFLLVLCMVAGITFSNVGATEVQADDTATAVTTTLRPITFADFGLADGKYEGQTWGANYISSAEKTESPLTDVIFSGYVTLNDADAETTTQEVRLNFGYSDGWGGLIFRFSADGKTMEVNTGNIGTNGYPYIYSAGEDFSFKNTRFKLSFSLECKDLDHKVVDETTGIIPENDLLLKVYINDKLCKANESAWAGQEATYGSNGEYYIFNMETEKLKGYIRNQYVGTTDGYYDSISMESCELPYNNTSTFVDYGMSDQVYAGENLTGTFAGPLAYTQLRGNITLNGGGVCMLNYGSTTAQEAIDATKHVGGLQLQIAASASDSAAFWVIVGNNRLGTSYLNEADGGVEGLNTQYYSSGMPIGEKFDVSFNTIPWDWDGDGTATDGKIEIRVNGTLLKNQYIVIEDMFVASTSLVNRFSILAAGNFGGSGTVTIESKAQDVSRLRKVELEDFGLTNGDYIKHVHNSVGPTTLLNTMMEINLSVEDSAFGSQIQYAVPLDKGEWYGAGFTILKDTITVYHAEGRITGGTIKASEIKRDSFCGDSFKFGLSLEKIDFHGDGNNDDARLGVWLQDKLVRNYYYIDNVNEVGTGMSVFPYLKAEELYANTVTVTDVKENSNAFTTTLGLSDVNAKVVAPGVYGGDAVTNPEVIKTMYPKNTAEKTGSLDGTIFSTNARFSKEGVQLFYGCPTETEQGWRAIWIGSDEKAPETFGVYYAGNLLETIHAGVAGVKLFDNTYKLSISTKYVDSDGDDLFDDLEVGIWFNDVLYNNTYFYVDSVTSELNPNIAVRQLVSDGYIVLGNYEQQKATVVTHCADEFAYFADGDEVTVDDKAQGTSWNTSTPGEYEVTYTNGTSADDVSTFKEHVVVYKTNDVTEDGVVTVVDLVAMLKLAEGERDTKSLAGKEAVGYVEGPEWDVTEVQKSMYAKLLADENTIQAKVMSEEIKGQTGSLTKDGKPTYITSLGATKEGTSVIGISDVSKDGSEEYVTNIDAFDGSGLDFVLDFDTNREIKVLQITDTQIIDSDQIRPGRELNEGAKTAWAPQYMDDVLFNELDTLIENQKPDLILLTGDIIYGEFDDEGTSLNALIEKLDSHKIPWAPIFGNHDNESKIGVTEQCRRFVEASKYCIFNRRNEIGGNGNYSIGISVKGEIQRTIFMMDTNGCTNISGVEKDADKEAITTSFVFHDEQIAWYRSTAEKVNEHMNGAKIPSFLCVHVPLAEVTTALVENGYQAKADSTYVVKENGIDVTKTISHNYTIGSIKKEIAADETVTWTYEKDNENFGFKEGTTIGHNSMSEFILPYLKAAGTDGAFFGHQHVNSISVKWEGMRFTYGLKTGRYDASPNQTGGTVITLNGDKFDVNHSIITNDNAE